MKRKRPRLRFSRLLPVIVLLVGGVAFFMLDGPSYIRIDLLKEYRYVLLEWVEKFGVLSPLIYTLLYALTVAFSLPIGLIMTLAGGFLFGIVTGLICTVIGATIGATAIFLAVRMGFGPAIETKNATWVNRMRDGFQENAFNYMLILRLIPIFPFFIVNIAPALLGVSLSVYFFGTLIGIIPGSFVFILVGNGLGATFDAGGTPDVNLMLKPEILTPLIGLALLALLPVIYKALVKKDTKKSSRRGRPQKRATSAKKAK